MGWFLPIWQLNMADDRLKEVDMESTWSWYGDWKNSTLEHTEENLLMAASK